jgi:hypothetical protein
MGRTATWGSTALRSLRWRCNTTSLAGIYGLKIPQLARAVKHRQHGGGGWHGFPFPLGATHLVVAAKQLHCTWPVAGRTAGRALTRPSARGIIVFGRWVSRRWAA